VKIWILKLLGLKFTTGRLIKFTHFDLHYVKSEYIFLLEKDNNNYISQNIWQSNELIIDLNIKLVLAIILFIDFNLCNFFCFDSVLAYWKKLLLVPKVTLLDHVAPHVMIILGHIGHQWLKTSIFNFLGTKIK
jgi:hypothetical protein